MGRNHAGYGQAGACGRVRGLWRCPQAAAVLASNNRPATVRHLAGAGLTDVSCREVGAFKKPRGDDKTQQMDFQLLMCCGTKAA